MKPASFDYFSPETTAEVVQLLSDWGDDAKVLAGGQSLVPILSMRLTRFAALIDIGRVPALREVRSEPGSVVIGATVRQREVEINREIEKVSPLLTMATPFIGHFQIRSRGTIGGSLAHADPAAEYPAVSVALDAEFELAGPSGTRIVGASDFFLGTWMTVMEPNEVLAFVRFPAWGPGAGYAVEEVGRRHGDFALAGACVAVQLVGGQVDRVAISMFGLGSTPIRAQKAEKAIRGCNPCDVDAEEIGQMSVSDVDPPDDIHASAALRRRIGATVVRRALVRALEEATADE